MIILWILMTFAIATLSMVIAKKHGPSFAIAMVAALAVIANVLASAKIVDFFIWSMDAGTLAYAAIFLVSDMITEIYGIKEARKAVWAGFFASFTLLASVWIASQWPGATFWEGEAAFNTIFGNTWRIVIASLTAYMISVNIDVWLFSQIKRKTHGKYLFLRNNISTWISQLADTVIFTTIAFLGVFPILEMMIGLYLAKVMIALLDTPFIYFSKWYHNARLT